MSAKQKITINKRNLISSTAVGFIIALCNTSGFVIKHNHSLKFGIVPVLYFVAALFAASVLTFLIYILSERLFGLSLNNEEEGRKAPFEIFLIGWIFFLICWAPIFLALYPGLFAYDNQWQYFMVVNNDISTHQPVIHTLILGNIIYITEKITGSINKGVAAYTIFQAVVMGAGCSYIAYSVFKRNKSLVPSVLTALFLAFYPVLTIFVFTGTKDSIFSIALADFMILNFELFENPDGFFGKKGKKIFWIILAFVVLSFRSNAVYPFVLTIPFAAFFIIKKSTKKREALSMILILAALYVAYAGPFCSIAAKEKVSKAEMMSVPCQQMMRVYKYHNAELPEEEKALFDEFYDPDKWYGYYVPEIADASKGSLRMEVYSAKKSEFWGLWKNWLKRYPGEYVDSFFENTYGFYYMWPKYVLYSYGQEAFTVMHHMQPSVPNSKIPSLYAFLCKFEDGSIVMGNFFVSWIFAPATFLFLSVMAIVYVIKGRKYNLCIPILFIVLLWMTYLLGPVASVRYQLYLYILFPIWPIYMKAAFLKENGR